MELDSFTKAYITCMLWAENDESTPQGGEPLDLNYSEADLSPLARATAWRECRNFQEAAEGLIGSKKAQAGHDFWLTRNGHGAGFWDRPEIYGKQNAEILTRLAKVAGRQNAVVGDDRQIHLEAG